MTEIPDVTGLSLRARLAVALHLFRGYCECRGLQHVEIDRYLTYLWEFVGSSADTGREPELIHVGLGDPFPLDFLEAMASAGVRESEFRQALELSTEVLYINMHGATNESRTREFLAGLAAVVVPLRVQWPDLSVFNGSRWSDAGGWGNRLSVDELARWKTAKPPEQKPAPEPIL
jgi:hypothetical protein